MLSFFDSGGPCGTSPELMINKKIIIIYLQSCVVLPSGASDVTCESRHRVLTVGSMNFCYSMNSVMDI